MVQTTYLYLATTFVMIITEFGGACPASHNEHHLALLTSSATSKTVPVNALLEFELAQVSHARKSSHECMHRMGRSAFLHPHIPSEIISMLWSRQYSVHILEYTFTAWLLGPCVTVAQPLRCNSSLSSICCMSVRKCSRETGS